LGSGKFGTPWERMHWEKPTPLADAELLGEPDALAADPT
jgi:hypothetical protein